MYFDQNCFQSNDFVSILPLDIKTLADNVCKCTAYRTVGPYCEKWWAHSKEWCILKESLYSKYCPGAIPMTSKGYAGVYYTDDKIICNKSKRKYVHYCIILELVERGHV